jgi:HlyD family secretion protein
VKRLTLGIPLVLVRLVFCGAYVNYRNYPQEICYVTAPVEIGTVHSQTTSTGTAKPVIEVLVGSQLSGTIKGAACGF